MLTTAEKENSSESEIEDKSVESSEEEDADSYESTEERAKHEIPCIDIKQPKLYLLSVWDSLSSPVSEENLIGKWYTIIFDGEKIPHLLTAKFDRRFLQDENGPLAAIDYFCLNENIRCDTNNLLEEDKRNKKDTIVASILICRPLTCSFNGRGKWLVEQYCNVKMFFDVLKNLDRKQMYNKSICKGFHTDI